MTEGWSWVVVEPEFDYQQAAMARIEAFSKELTDEEEQKLASLQDQLETLSNEAEQVGPADDTCAEAETPQEEIEALTEEVWRPEDIARAGVFVALGRERRSPDRAWLPAGRGCAIVESSGRHTRPLCGADWLWDAGRDRGRGIRAFALRNWPI